MSEREIKSLAASIFHRAAAYIRTYGWQKEGMGEPGAARCSMGALQGAYGRTAWDKSLASTMYEALNRELGGISLTQFNSRYDDGEAVAQLYDQVALRLSPRS